MSKVVSGVWTAHPRLALFFHGELVFAGPVCIPLSLSILATSTAEARNLCLCQLVKS